METNFSSKEKLSLRCCVTSVSRLSAAIIGVVTETEKRTTKTVDAKETQATLRVRKYLRTFALIVTA